VVKQLAFAIGFFAPCAVKRWCPCSPAWSGTSIEPGFYRLQQSVIILCIVIVGGTGNVTGVIARALPHGGLQQHRKIDQAQWRLMMARKRLDWRQRARRPELEVHALRHRA
jgi:hypothetical protein